MFKYGENHLTISKVLELCSGEEQGALTTAQREKVLISAKRVDNIVAGNAPVYGVNTGFGPLCNTMIKDEDVEKLQYNLLISHSMGVGSPITPQLGKIMLILKLHALSRGFSGVSVEIIDRILWHIEEDIIPHVPSQGSVGASGDLAPLSHCFIPLLGLGKVYEQGVLKNTSSVLSSHNLNPIALQAKDGLALINGTQFICAHAVLIIDKLHNCLNQADINGALMVESLLGSAKPFHPDLHKLRPFPGNLHVANNVYNLLIDSEINNSHANCSQVQDPYSMRCIPQVHGSSREAWLHLKEKVEIELNSVTDNPVVLTDGSTISGGNFHGQPLAMAIDYACLASSELGNISDRRIYLALEGKSEGVPKLLMKDLGLNSGFMIMQYTSAALASENKTFCFPASADSIPTSLGQEDHVSMGSISGRKCLQVVENLEKILAIEMVVAAQAIDFRKPMKPHPALQELHAKLREKVIHAENDDLFHAYIEDALELVKGKQFTSILNKYKSNGNAGSKSKYEHLFEVY